MVEYLLDTNICIYIAKKNPSHLQNKLEHLEIGQVGMSVITYGELLYGVEKSAFPKKNREVLHELIGLIPPMPIPNDAAKHYGEMRFSLEKQGKIIGNNDLWIASHALALNLILITNNIKEFKRIKSLKLDSWI